MKKSASIFHEARLVLQAAPPSARRDHLRNTVDACKEVFDRFAISAAPADMQLLVARYTHLLIAIAAMPPSVQPDPTAGRLHAPVAQAA